MALLWLFCRFFNKQRVLITLQKVQVAFFFKHIIIASEDFSKFITLSKFPSFSSSNIFSLFFLTHFGVCSYSSNFYCLFLKLIFSFFCLMKWVDRPLNEPLRNQSGLNPHPLFL
jgi:hypothetical protein